MTSVNNLEAVQISTMTPYRYSWADKKPVVKEGPAHEAAKKSFGWGVMSCVCSWFSILGIIFSFVGLAKASKAKSLGDNSEARKAGILFCILGLLGSLAIAACLVFCIIFGNMYLVNDVFKSDAVQNTVTQVLE